MPDNSSDCSRSRCIALSRARTLALLPPYARSTGSFAKCNCLRWRAVWLSPRTGRYRASFLSTPVPADARNSSCLVSEPLLNNFSLFKSRGVSSNAVVSKSCFQRSIGSEPSKLLELFLALNSSPESSQSIEAPSTASSNDSATVSAVCSPHFLLHSGSFNWAAVGVIPLFHKSINSCCSTENRGLF